jgi:hypothetical protein
MNQQGRASQLDILASAFRHRRSKKHVSAVVATGAVHISHLRLGANNSTTRVCDSCNSHNTDIGSLNDDRRLVFVMQTPRVYCEVETEGSYTV